MPVSRGGGILLIAPYKLECSLRSQDVSVFVLDTKNLGLM